MDAQNYIVKVMQSDEVVFEVEIVLPAEDKIVIIEIPPGHFPADARHCEILIEKVEPTTGDSAEAETPVDQ